MDIPSQNARYVPIFKEHESASTPFRFKSMCVCAVSFRVSRKRWFGGSGRTRTTGLTLIRGALYPPELQTQKSIATGRQRGGACRDRTDDPLLAKQVLSQLS